MCDNRDKAKECFTAKILDSDTPVLIAYYDQDEDIDLPVHERLIAYDINWACVDLWVSSSKMSSRIAFRNKNLDSPIYYLFADGELAKAAKFTPSDGEIIMESAKGDGLLKYIAYWHSWGVEFHFSKPKASIYQVISLNNRISELLEKAGSIIANLKILYVGFSAAVLYFGASMTFNIPQISLSNQSDPVLDLQHLLTTEATKLRGPTPAAIFVFVYSPDYTQRTLVTGSSKYLSPDELMDRPPQFTSVIGWKDMLAAHLDTSKQRPQRVAILTSDTYPVGSQIRETLLTDLGVEQVYGYPLYINKQLKGYFSMGFYSKLTEYEDILMRQQGLSIASKVEADFDKVIEYKQLEEG